MRLTAKSCLYGSQSTTSWPFFFMVETTVSTPRRIGGCGRTWICQSEFGGLRSASHTTPSLLKKPRANPPDESLDLITSASPCRQGIGITFESYFHGSSCKTALVNSLMSAKRVSLPKKFRSVGVINGNKEGESDEQGQTKHSLHRCRGILTYPPLNE